MDGYARPMAAPDLFQYLDYRRYLADWFRARKAANPRFSHRAFVRRIGQRSPSTLRDVIEGRRNLTPQTTEAFCDAMGLNAEERDFFTALVHLDQATGQDERNRAWNRIAATRRFNEARRLEGDGFRYLSHWYYPAIRELAGRDDFDADPAWIAARLRPSITVAQARTALKELLELGLLVEQEDGTVAQRDSSVVTPHEVAGLAAHNYHAGMLALAGEAIERFRPFERHFCGVTVSIPEEMIPRLKRELNAFQERLLDLCGGVDEPVERVVQINLNFFPLSSPAGPPREE